MEFLEVTLRLSLGVEFVWVIYALKPAFL